jgi:glutamate formiminotransferase
LAQRAVELIDLRPHGGIHPRLGVVDVVPFVPLVAVGDQSAHHAETTETPVKSDASGPLGDTPALTEALAARGRFVTWFAGQGVPCFEYGPERSLPEVRRRAFRDLWPSSGPDHPHETAGACCVGARHLLVAYNVVLRADTETARAIARDIRRPLLRVLGLDLAGTGQVSFNLVSPLDIGPAEAYDLVAARAPIADAELVGLLPRAVLRAIPERRWAELGLSEETTIEARLSKDVD